ncbi:MAG TPA: hypothetical protein VML94_05815 [Thermoplasmata archaeon]|nr:hypothetical protein [Thermoplasmata archaeon]
MTLRSAHPSTLARRSPVRAPRAWRRRSRKAQVSAVATILGLLLVVTFVANYLTTTLPQYMSVNDVNHDLLVQNEVGRFSALLRDVSAAGAIDAALTQPLVLGSEGLAPFATPDPSSVSSTSSGSSESVSFGLSGTTPGLVYQVSTGAAFYVLLQNRYAPVAEVAYDYGAVVFTQQDGIPAMIDPPPITMTGSGASRAATIWMPVFSAPFASEGGTETAILGLTLTSVTSQTFPSGGFTITGSHVTVRLTTPYSAAWMAYFDASSTFAGDATCTPVASSVCSPTGTFITTGAVGTVTLVLPVSTVTLAVATFTIGLD